jgi:hypothetical protein
MSKSFLSFNDFFNQLNENSESQKFSPDFTPHEEFHKYRWMITPGGKWYYKIKDFKPCVLPKNPDFKKTVDPELQRVVHFLHAKKIPTTPSCSGHFNHAGEWAEHFDSLQLEGRKIKNLGMKLIDPEDGYTFLAKDPNYSLPWNKNSFVEKATEHQKLGVLGFYDPGNFFAKKIFAERIPNSQVKKDGALTLFLTSPKSSSELKECWSNFTECITKNPLSY